MEDIATIFKALADTTRLRLAVLLAQSGETCVCHLAQALGERDYKISRHLGVMRSAGLVEARREGTWMHYRLSEGRNEFDRLLREILRISLANHPLASADRERMTSTCCEAQ